MEPMKQLVIDRLDVKYAICTDSDQKFYAIELPEVPQGAKAGSVLRITDEGELQLDVEATQRRQQGPQGKRGGKKR